VERLFRFFVLYRCCQRRLFDPEVCSRPQVSRETSWRCPSSRTAFQRPLALEHDFALRSRRTLDSKRNMLTSYEATSSITVGTSWAWSRLRRRNAVCFSSSTALSLTRDQTGEEAVDPSPSGLSQTCMSQRLETRQRSLAAWRGRRRNVLIALLFSSPPLFHTALTFIDPYPYIIISTNPAELFLSRSLLNDSILNSFTLFHSSSSSQSSHLPFVPCTLLSIPSKTLLTTPTSSSPSIILATSNLLHRLSASTNSNFQTTSSSPSSS